MSSPSTRARPCLVDRRGHALEEVGGLYSKLKEDVTFRQKRVGRIGLVLNWSTLVHKMLQ
jgi:hypothetical protein